MMAAADAVLQRPGGQQVVIGTASRKSPGGANPPRVSGPGENRGEHGSIAVDS